MALPIQVPNLPFDQKVVTFYSYKGGVGRTMAMCNVAARLSQEAARRGRQSIRILCIDFDIEAPSVGMLLPPAPRRGRARGLLGLINDFEYGLPECRASEDWMVRAVRPGNDNPYAYAVDGASNLYVLPAGDAGDRSYTEARRVLARWLDDAMRTAAPGGGGDDTVARRIGKGKLDFFRFLKEAVRAHYTYVLVDSRTGLADEAFASTVGLADAMVLVFRPSVAQLIGVQAVLGRFLYERNRRADDPTVPVVPVLSPRPPYSSKALQDLRCLARQEVFKWLDDRARPGPAATFIAAAPAAGAPAAADGPAAERGRTPAAAADIIELPYDSSLEVGDKLLMPVDPAKDPQDTGAPLYRSYLALVEALQWGNAGNDVDGAERVELWHYANQQTREAFKYLVARIAREPDDRRHWEDLWLRYGEHLKSDDDSATLLWELCTAADREADPSADPSVDGSAVRRFFGNLYLSEVRESQAPDLCVRLMIRAWATARAAADPGLLRHALNRLGRYYGRNHNRPVDPAYAHVPGPEATARALAYVRLNESADGRAAGDALGRLSDYMLWAHDAGGDLPDQLLDVLGDRLAVAAPADRPEAFGALGRTYVYRNEFAEAAAAYAEACAAGYAPHGLRCDYVRLLCKVGLEPYALEQIDKYMVPQERAKWRLLLRLGRRVPYAWVHQQLSGDEFQQLDADVVNRPTLEAYPLLWERRFPEAVKRLDEGRPPGDPMSHFALQSVARWLADGSQPDPSVTAWALRELESEFHPLDRRALLVAVAADARGVLRVADRMLERPLWRLQRWSWAVVACGTKDGARRWRPVVEEELRDRPLLALYARHSEKFPVLKEVWSRLGRNGAPGGGAGGGKAGPARGEVAPDLAVDVLELIDRWQADPIWKDPKRPPADAAAADPGQQFGRIVEKWLRRLESIRADPDVGPIVNTVLASPEAPHGAGPDGRAGGSNPG